LCSLVFVLIGLLATSSGAVAEVPIDESQTPAYRTALALNYAHASLYTITDYNDRVVLSQEYNDILSNIKLAKIRDKEVIELLKKLLDTLNRYMLSEKEQRLVRDLYQQKIDQAFYEGFAGSGNGSGGSGASLMTSAANPPMLAFVMVVQVADAYSNYRENVDAYRNELDQELWELEKEQSVQLTNLRKQFLMYYWKLMRKYEIPDHWRITEDQFAMLLDILKESDKSKRYRRLERIKEQFEAYPPFWYYLGRVAQELELYDSAREAYDFVINRHFDYFRDDNIYSSILLNRTQLYSLNGDEERIRELLKEVLEASPLDGRKVLAVALYYGQLEEYEKATELLQGNIDEDFMVPLNTRLLAEFKSKADSNESEEEYKAIVNRMTESVNFKNHDILYLIGRSNASDLLKRFAKEVVKIDIGYKSRLMTNSLMVTLPRKWVLYGDNKAPSAPTIEYLNGELAPKSSQVNDETKSVTFRYDGFLPLKEFPGKEFPYELQINLPSRDMPVRLVAQYYKKEEAKEGNSLMDQAWKMVGQGERENTVEAPAFEFHQLQTENHCYTIESNSLQPGC